jgi:biotin carboxyl carrier protein
MLQFNESKDGLYFNFYLKGNTVETLIFDENQFKLKHHMAPPIKIDHTKSVLSPMPGSIVSVNVQVGQIV